MTSQCSCWDLRFTSDDKITKDMLITKFNAIAKKWVFQQEQGEKTGYVHFQCRISLIKKSIKKSLLKLFEGMEPGYCIPTIKENYQNDNVFYVIKEQTRIAGPWKSTDPKPKFIPKQFRHIKDLYLYQNKIVNGNFSHNYRNCNNLYDPSGNIGKSTTAFMCYLHNNAIYIPPMNDAQKVIEYVYSIIENMKDDETPEMMIFDLPRSMSKDCLFGMYSAIEQLKTGYIYDTRYKGRGRWINSPNIWVFTNELPDTSRLTSDRWNIWIIDDKKDLVKYDPNKPDDIGDIEIYVPQKRLIKNKTI